MSKHPYLIALALVSLAAVPAEARQCAPGQKQIKVSNVGGGKYACVAQKPAPAPRKQTCWRVPGPGGSVKIACN